MSDASENPNAASDRCLPSTSSEPSVTTRLLHNSERSQEVGGAGGGELSPHGLYVGDGGETSQGQRQHENDGRAGDTGGETSLGGPRLSRDEGGGEGSGSHRSSRGYNVQIKEPPMSERHGQGGRGSRGELGGRGGEMVVIKSEQKYGPLYNAIPSMPLAVAVVCCVLNILLPGTGA